MRKVDKGEAKGGVRGLGEGRRVAIVGRVKTGE